MKILIDYGHGIDTKGKRSPDGRLLEYAQNRLLAGRIVSALQARGLDASLLVPEETDISLPERCRRVNEWCRQLGKDNVLLISIHCRCATSTRISPLLTVYRPWFWGVCKYKVKKSFRQFSSKGFTTLQRD